jgi:Na+-transporting NADH:ubiquinone oxidoreductase subunit C
VPENILVDEVRDDSGALEMVILPIWGKGLWSTLYGFLALDSDLRTISGITFYDHKETPGLGGEVDNPRWKSLWRGRQAFDETGEVAIEVIKGRAGPPDEDPYLVDGLTGATITSRGVGNFVQFWLGEAGYGPYLDRLRGEI